MAAKFIVTRTENKLWLVEGEIAVIRGKVVNNPYKRAFHLKNKADFEADRLNKINETALADLALVKAARLAAIQDYLATRASRYSATQTTLDF